MEYGDILQMLEKFKLYPECHGSFSEVLSWGLMGSGVHLRKRRDMYGTPPVHRPCARGLKHIIKQRFYFPS